MSARLETMERLSAAVVGEAPRGWFWRREIPTVLVALAIYAAWIALLWFHAVLPWWLLALLGGYVLQWHFSLQHESIHGWRSMPDWLRTTLVWPPIGLWFPYALYRRSHSQHHRNTFLTVPGEDTESFYHAARAWAGYGPLWRGLMLANQTFLGRVLLGPVLRIPRMWRMELRRVLSGDYRNVGIWLRHVLGVAAVLVLVIGVFDLPFWQYLLLFFYPGAAFGMMRSFIEHRWGERPAERTAIVESNWVFGLMFLFNNLHAVHHTFPTLSWYRIPGVWRVHRQGILKHNGGYVFSGYAELARRWLLKPVFVPVHPGGGGDRLQTRR